MKTATQFTTPATLHMEVNYFAETYNPTGEELARLRNAASRNAKSLSQFFTDLYDNVVQCGSVQDRLNYYRIA